MAHTTEVGDDRYDLPEIGKDEGIEPVTGTPSQLKDAEKLEAFMNEYVTIVIATSTMPGTNPVVVPQVNSTTQPIPRGVKMRVKRKYIEVLARNKKEDFKQYEHQRVQDLPDNMNIKFMKGTSGLVDTFQVIDENPLGAEWLQAILDEKR